MKPDGRMNCFGTQDDENGDKVLSHRRDAEAQSF
jgi:hypothetical protein